VRHKLHEMYFSWTEGGPDKRMGKGVRVTVVNQTGFKSSGNPSMKGGKIEAGVSMLKEGKRRGRRLEKSGKMHLWIITRRRRRIELL